METRPLKLHDLKIHKEYRRLVQPLGMDARSQLEGHIRQSACQEPMRIWCGRILVDFERYELFHRLQIPFSVVIISAKSGEEAIDWICRNQLQRDDLTKEMRKYLIGRRFLAQRIIASHYASSVTPVLSGRPTLLTGEPKYETSVVRIRERLGHEYQVNQTTIRMYADFTMAIDTIHGAVPELAERLLSGRLSMSYHRILALARRTPADLQTLNEDLSAGGDSMSAFFAVNREKSPNTQMLPTGSVKDMPNYDPDAELASLTLTIPSWCSSIQRAASSVNFANASSGALVDVRQELLALKREAEKMLHFIKEQEGTLYG